MNAPSAELVPFTVRLSRDEHERLTELAASEHRSLGAEARRGIVAHLDAQASLDEAAA